MKVLITGISSAFSRMVALDLMDKNHEVLGIDRRPWPDAPRGIKVFKADIRKRPAEDIFRTTRPDAVIHMATVTHFSASSEVRFRINLRGTRAIFDNCHKYEVKQAIFIGRHTVYGAASDAPLFYTENDPPMAASTFPELADLVAADMFAGSALWRWPELNTAVLRIVYTLGPSRRGTLARYLAGKRIPMVLGFDPLFQFMHEQDAAKAIVLALEKQLRGVYNIVGPQPVPLSLLCKVAGRQAIPLPEMIFPAMLGRFGFSWLPQGAVNHIKYPHVVDGTLFREATGFEYDFDESQTMEAYRNPG